MIGTQRLAYFRFMALEGEYSGAGLDSCQKALKRGGIYGHCKKIKNPPSAKVRNSGITHRRRPYPTLTPQRRTACVVYPTAKITRGLLSFSVACAGKLAL